ncbi:MAG: SAM-dependent methyltransferase, partial [Bacteroidetes bacterium]|nr:SAM-dependent methyltransferase [Bacteroidota bacterium]
EGDHLKIVDMGSGKGYLTFALYDYLNNSKGFSAEVLGIEQRNELVEFCNKLATDCKFENVKFKHGSINDTKLKNADVLIALHACDTATDDAIAKGIKSGANVIVCAPCCHTQIRVQMSEAKVDIPQLKFGILMERQAEIITDTIRALMMEQYGYDSRIFEFISSEHTDKNLMIAGIKTRKKIDTETIQKKINGLKEQYGIKQHYLEKLLISS